MCSGGGGVGLRCSCARSYFTCSQRLPSHIRAHSPQTPSCTEVLARPSAPGPLVCDARCKASAPPL